MKLEIRKETKPDGDMFYQVYQDDRYLKAFWIGNRIEATWGTYGGVTSETAAWDAAVEYYERVKINAQSKPIIEVVQSETIETTTHEPA